MKYLFSLLLSISTLVSFGQNLTGQVVTINDKNQLEPLVGANLIWQGTGIGTTTDENGKFYIEKTTKTNILISSYIGFDNDTTNMEGIDEMMIMLQKSLTLKEIQIISRRKSTHLSHASALKIENIGEGELLKAACCNLSESFETSPSVDVSFTDAVTGTRQIQMLGLAGPYTQITNETMPGIRGLSAIQGLLYVPGTWIKGIQLNKGIGSVVNGFESIAGQINLDLRKPEKEDPFFLNTYFNSGGAMELNAHMATKINDKVSTLIMIHGKHKSIAWDKNEDSFMDQPIAQNFIGLNRWKFDSGKNFRGQIGFKLVNMNQQAGQISDLNTNNALWTMNMVTKKIEAWSKFGIVFPERPGKSIGFQLLASNHNQRSNFGHQKYDANHTTYCAQIMYDDFISNTDHKIRTGFRMMYENYHENLSIGIYNRIESVPGAFLEYNATLSEKVSFVAGLRGDYHNNYGLFFTPRLHVRLGLSDNTIVRLSGGKGYKTANIFAEHIGLLASSRVYLNGEVGGYGYGNHLKQESAWNYGINLVQNFRIGGKEGVFSMDFYRTDFVNQIVLNIETPTSFTFGNLEGESFSNSFQTQLDYELVRNFDLRLAYRMFDVQTTYNGVLKQKPLSSKHRAFLNLAYKTDNDWGLDGTLSWQSKKRIPSTASNPTSLQLDEYSPSFFMINGQISKSWNKRFDLYLGVENLLNYIQEAPILDAQNPFSEYFDASLVWGPIFGRKIYAGMRWRLF